MLLTVTKIRVLFYYIPVGINKKILAVRRRRTYPITENFNFLFHSSVAKMTDIL